MSIYNLGSVNIDHVYQIPHFVRPGETLASGGYARVLGGKGTNQSVALAKAGAEVHHIGCLGQSDQDFYQQIEQAGVKCEALLLVPEPSGHAMIQVSPEGENAIVLFGGANQTIPFTHIQSTLDAAADGDWLLTQNETSHVAQTLQAAKKRGLQTVYNPAPINGIEQSVQPDWVDVLIVNQTEAEALTGLSEVQQQVSYFSEHWSHAQVVLTLGGEGAVLVSSQGVLSVSAYETEAVDTTAAGDTFIGFFLAAIDASELPADAMHYACAAAALAVQKPGAAQSIPTAEEVEEFLAEFYA